MPVMAGKDCFLWPGDEFCGYFAHFPFSGSTLGVGAEQPAPSQHQMAKPNSVIITRWKFKRGHLLNEILKGGSQCCMADFFGMPPPMAIGLNGLPLTVTCPLANSSFERIIPLSSTI